MPIAIGNKRLPVTLDEKRQKELQELKQKYGKSESRIMCIALDLLIAQEKAGFDVPALKKWRHFSFEETKVIALYARVDTCYDYFVRRYSAQCHLREKKCLSYWKKMAGLSEGKRDLIIIFIRMVLESLFLFMPIKILAEDLSKKF